MITHNRINIHNTRYKLIKPRGRARDQIVRKLCMYLGTEEGQRDWKSYYILSLNVIVALETQREGMLFSSDESFYSKKIPSCKGGLFKSDVSYTYSKSFVADFQELGLGVLDKGYHFVCKGTDEVVSKSGAILFTSHLNEVVSGLCEFQMYSVKLDEALVMIKNRKNGEFLFDNVNAGYIRGLQLRMEAYNRYMNEVDVKWSGGKVNTETERLFLDDIQYYGRLHGQYQNLPKQDRESITFNGESTVEIDVVASHPTILYGLCGEYNKPDEMYDPSKITIAKISRKLYKLCLMVIINSKSKISAIKALQNDSNWRETEIKDAKVIADILTEIEIYHEPICNYFYSGRSLELMLLESDYILDVIETLMDIGIPSLSVHDSLIVKESDMRFVVDVMANKFRDKFGIFADFKVE